MILQLVSQQYPTQSGHCCVNKLHLLQFKVRGWVLLKHFKS